MKIDEELKIQENDVEELKTVVVKYPYHPPQKNFKNKPNLKITQKSSFYPFHQDQWNTNTMFSRNTNIYKTVNAKVFRKLSNPKNYSIEK